MTIEEMRALREMYRREGWHIDAQTQQDIAIALCERLDAQNALLERIALAMEGQIKP